MGPLVMGVVLGPGLSLWSHKSALLTVHEADAAEVFGWLSCSIPEWSCTIVIIRLYPESWGEGAITRWGDGKGKCWGDGTWGIGKVASWCRNGVL